MSQTNLEPVSPARLWKVTLEYTVLVVADNERAAASEAEYNVGKDGTETDRVSAAPVTTIEDVPGNWRNCIPFGGDLGDERTCRERLPIHQPPA